MSEFFGLFCEHCNSAFIVRWRELDRQDCSCGSSGVQLIGDRPYVMGAYCYVFKIILPEEGWCSVEKEIRKNLEAYRIGAESHEALYQVWEHEQKRKPDV